MNTRMATASKPVVYVDEVQKEQLQQLADKSITEGTSLLHSELERAFVVRAGEVPQQFVRLNSIVEFEDLLSGKIRTVTLVRPEHADIDRNLISVVTPVGAAVLGLVAGECFSWTTEDGRPRVLVVRRVVNS
jgi:regulator of nucleoside diphosphate kinase